MHAIRGCRGSSVETVTCLIRALYLTYVIGKQVHGEDENAALAEAERTLSSWIALRRGVDDGARWVVEK